MNKKMLLEYKCTKEILRDPFPSYIYEYILEFLQTLEFLTVIVLTFVLSQCFIVKLLTVSQFFYDNEVMVKTAII